MKILDLITYVRSAVNFQYYPNKFPRDSQHVPNACAVVAIQPGSGIDEWTGKKQPSFQVLVRGETNGDGPTETRAYEIFNALANKKDVTIGGESVVIIRPLGSAPFYIGADANDRPIYSMNFNVVLRPAPHN